MRLLCYHSTIVAIYLVTLLGNSYRFQLYGTSVLVLHLKHLNENDFLEGMALILSLRDRRSREVELQSDF